MLEALKRRRGPSTIMLSARTVKTAELARGEGLTLGTGDLAGGDLDGGLCGEIAEVGRSQRTNDFTMP